MGNRSEPTLNSKAVVRGARERSIKRLQRMDGPDLDKAKVMQGAWR